VKKADGSNMRAPLSAVENKVQKKRYELWIVCHKVDPTQDWGDFEVEWEVTPKPELEV
jgi:hypothetical protein